MQKMKRSLETHKTYSSIYPRHHPPNLHDQIVAFMIVIGYIAVLKIECPRQYMWRAHNNQAMARQHSRDSSKAFGLKNAHHIRTAKVTDK